MARRRRKPGDPVPIVVRGRLVAVAEPFQGRIIVTVQPALGTPTRPDGSTNPAYMAAAADLREKFVEVGTHEDAVQMLIAAWQAKQKNESPSKVET
jgi:hypothetical protein